jgi:hypothetical protein
MTGAQHGFGSLGDLESDRSFFSWFGTGLFPDNLVFCLDELHEGPEILGGLEGEPGPSPLSDLIAQPPVDGLVFGETDPGLEVSVKGRAHLPSSEVQVEELAAFVEESRKRLVTMLLVQDFHRDAFQLAHTGSKCLE